MNENENTTTPNLWDTVKAALRGRFMATQAYHAPCAGGLAMTAGSIISSQLRVSEVKLVA